MSGTTVDWLGPPVLWAANSGAFADAVTSASADAVTSASVDAVTGAVLADPETHLPLIGTVFMIIGMSAANV